MANEINELWIALKRQYADANHMNWAEIDRIKSAIVDKIGVYLYLQSTENGIPNYEEVTN